MVELWRMEDATKRAELEKRQRRRDHFYQAAPVLGRTGDHDDHTLPEVLAIRAAKWAEMMMALADEANAAEAGKGEM